MSSSPHSSSGSSTGPSPYQDQLISFCRQAGLRTPTWQIMSDRRGGRTAWSSSVNLQGQSIPARFWYDGQYVNNAREDAAQIALQRLGQLPAAGVPHQQQHQQQPPSNQQRSHYGVIGS